MARTKALNIPVSNSDMQKPKDTLTEIKKNTVKMLRKYEEEIFDKELDIENWKAVADNLEGERNKVNEKYKKVMERNKMLEEATGDKRIKEINKVFNTVHMTDETREERIAAKAKERELLFKQYKIKEFLDNPNKSDKKKRN